MGTGKYNAGGDPAMDQHSIQAGVEILLITPCYRNRPEGPLGRYTDLIPTDLRQKTTGEVNTTGTKPYTDFYILSLTVHASCMMWGDEHCNMKIVRSKDARKQLGTNVIDVKLKARDVTAS